MPEVKIQRFNGGVLDDRRGYSENGYAFAYHFDTFRIPGAMYPNRSYITFTSDSKKVVKILYAKGYSGASAYMLYGMGETAGGKPEIFTATLGATAWSTISADADGTLGTKSDVVFFEYRIVIRAQGEALDLLGRVNETHIPGP